MLSAPAQAGQAERLSEVTQSERSSRCATRSAGCVTNSRLLLQSKPSARMCSQSSRATELSVGPFTAQPGPHPRDAGCSVRGRPMSRCCGSEVSKRTEVSYSTLASKGKIWSSQSVKAQAAPGVSRKRRRRYCSTPPCLVRASANLALRSQAVASWRSRFTERTGCKRQSSSTVRSMDMLSVAMLGRGVFPNWQFGYR